MSFCVSCFSFSLLFFKVHRYAGEPRHIGGHPPRRGPLDGDREKEKRKRGRKMQLTWPSRASKQLDKYKR